MVELSLDKRKVVGSTPAIPILQVAFILWVYSSNGRAVGF